MSDVVALTKALLSCDSVTPALGGVFDVAEAMLVPLGFHVERFVAGEAPDGPVENLLAVRGGGGRHFAFAGHLDVVPPGPGWTSAPRRSWSASPASTIATRRVLVFPSSWRSRAAIG